MGPIELPVSRTSCHGCYLIGNYSLRYFSKEIAADRRSAANNRAVTECQSFGAVVAGVALPR